MLLFLAKYRLLWSRIIGVVIAVYVLFYYPPKILPLWTLEVMEVFGLVLLTVAAFGRVWCYVFIGGKKNDVLARYGPYSVVRNPLYVFSFIGAVGFGFAVSNPILAGCLAIVFMAYYYFVVQREEKFLASKFGPSFQEYCASTPCWVPNFSLYQEPQNVTISPKIIRKGMLDAMWFIWVFVFWELLEELRVVDSFHVNILHLIGL